MKYVIIIPARSGSKGLVSKNMKHLNGRPMIYYTLKAAQACSFVDLVFLTTDSLEIRNFCESEGLTGPSLNYLRPTELSGDLASTNDVIMDVLSYLNTLNLYPENIIILQPTSPVRGVGHLEAAIKQYEESGKKVLISVSKVIEHPSECVEINNEGWEFLRGSDATRRQDYKGGFYFVNGAIYIYNTKHYLNHSVLLEKESTGFFIMEKEFGVDVDDLYDFCRAEMTLNYLNLKNIL